MSLYQSWRERMHVLTRDSRFVFKNSFIIVGIGLVIAILSSHPVRQRSWFEQVKENYQRLKRTENEPNDLADLLRMLASKREEAGLDWFFDSEALTLNDFDLRALSERHVKTGEQRSIFSDYARALLLLEEGPRKAARLRLWEAAGHSNPPRYTLEFAGDLWMKEGEDAKALAAYLSEGATPDAYRARQRAWMLAVKREDANAFRRMLQDGHYRREGNAVQMFIAARVVGDWKLATRAFLALEFRVWRHGEALLAIFAVSIWYFIMVYAGSNRTRRWTLTSLAVGAGVISTWVIDWAHLVFDYEHEADGPLGPGQSLIHLIIYVGLPEEIAKLMLFLPFLAVQLRQRDRSEVALTAGCVGLGFALAENIQYYIQSGATVALSRMITANFFHMALTGLLGVALYDWIRARCHNTDRFVFSLVAIVVVHGLYDFGCDEEFFGEDMGIVSTLLIALSARFYFREWKPEIRQRPRQAFASTAVFAFGCALLASVVLIAAGLNGDRREVFLTLQRAFALAPVAWIFVQEFREV